MPPCAGLRAHVELSRISGYIVCETFKIAPRNYRPGYSTVNVDKALRMLEDWKLQLPSELGIGEGADPAVISLHLASNQLIVLTTRPILLAAVKQAVAERYMNGQWSVQQHAYGRHIQACTKAAHCNLILAQKLRCTRKLLQAGLHFVFNAGVILLLQRILNYAGGDKKVNPTETTTPEIDFAMCTFEDESRTGTNYPRDCFKVLQDLKALVDRYLSRGHGAFEHGGYPGSVPSVPGPPFVAQQQGEVQGIARNVIESNDLYQEMRTWIQSDGLHLHNSLLI